MGNAIQVRQGPSRYWLWRFDQQVDPVPLDNLWGKTDEQGLADLQVANNPQVGRPEGVADVELAVDPYFPANHSVGCGGAEGPRRARRGRNRLFLDSHAKWLRDIRTNP
jgi:hypothetical protein